MIHKKLHKTSLEPFIFAMPPSQVTYSPDMQDLREALQQEIARTFAIWRQPAVTKPQEKTTKKICRVWKRVCWDETYISLL